MKTILGTGQLGIALMQMLLQKDPTEKITLVNRSGKLDMQLPKNVILLAADVTDKTAIESIAKRSELIFSCTDMPYQLWGSFYPATAAALAYALDRSDARLVFADNMYSYGNVEGKIMSEEMLHAAQTKKGMIRTAVINTLLSEQKSFSSRVAFVKAADFIGPRIHKGIFGKDFLDKLYQNKTIALFGKTQLPHTFTYINDFATAMLNVSEAPDTFGQIWHAPNAAPVSMKAWVKLFETATNKKAKIIVLPKFIVKLAGIFTPLIKEMIELGYQFEYPYLISDKKYRQRFGDHATSHEAIVDATLAWYNSTLK